MTLTIGYGKTGQEINIPEKNLLGVVTPNNVEVSAKGASLVRRALENPIGTKRLRETVRRGEKIAIITSDITRPLPSEKILPQVLDELESAGVSMDDVTVVFALGCHRKQTPDEMKKLVGADIYSKVKCVDGDTNDCIHMGVTSFGTPVDIVRTVAAADRRIAIGNIEYHYFAGYSGGAKAIMPGVSNRAAIQANHSRMVEEKAAAGRLDDNPVRDDIEEAVRNFCPLDFIVNVVLDEGKEIIYAAAGDAVKAHRAGCKFLDSLYRCELPARADIVVASQGGSPKDLNLYQTQKALDNAKYAVKNGGIIILVGACDEGFGEDCFEEWMTKSPSANSMIERIQNDFQLGGHKAAAIAMVLENAEVMLVSQMHPSLVRRMFLQPYSTAQAALNDAFDRLGGDATVLVMPFAGSTLVRVEEENTSVKNSKTH
ncbi:MAG: nickel-dependent lactate racemase [Oscillospiraceae bacterium]|nr:nickel-dependent lactate racemase [Oscillospiraceae bacterium]